MDNSLRQGTKLIICYNPPPKPEFDPYWASVIILHRSTSGTDHKFSEKIKSQNFIPVCNCTSVGATGECDHQTGQCVCKPNVIGFKCDECDVRSYNFSSGEGCYPCNCSSIGALSENCDVVSTHIFNSVKIAMDPLTIISWN